MTETGPGTAVEGEISPAKRVRGLAPFPALGTEVIRVRPVDVLSTSIDILREDDEFATSDKYRGGPVWPTAPWEDGSFDGCSVVQRYWRIEAKTYAGRSET